MADETDQINLSLLDSLARQRTISNYFFITINTIIAVVNAPIAILLIKAIVSSMGARYFAIAFPIMLSIVGSFLCLHWYQEQAEYRYQHEARYRAILDEERMYNRERLVSKEWDRLGNLPFRSSPVFMPRTSRLLPMLFMVLHYLSAALAASLVWAASRVE